MRAVDLRIQGAWLRRRGLRGRWITVYVHRYGGEESTERLHSHPWAVAFGIVLSGTLVETVRTEGSAPRRRGFLSVGVYRRDTLHRVEDGDAVTLFVGLLRAQRRIERAAEVRTAQGYCHYTEIMPDEAGFRPDFVAAGRSPSGDPRSARRASDGADEEQGSSCLNPFTFHNRRSNR